MSSWNFLFRNRGFSREERAIYVIYHIPDSKDRQKQKRIGSMTKKSKFFPKRVILKFWSAKIFSLPPNSAPSLHLWLHVTTTSFICVISACLIHSSTTPSTAWRI